MSGIEKMPELMAMPYGERVAYFKDITLRHILSGTYQLADVRQGIPLLVEREDYEAATGAQQAIDDILAVR